MIATLTNLRNVFLKPTIDCCSINDTRFLREGCIVTQRLLFQKSFSVAEIVSWRNEGATKPSRSSGSTVSSVSDFLLHRTPATERAPSRGDTDCKPELDEEDRFVEAASSATNNDHRRLLRRRDSGDDALTR